MTRTLGYVVALSALLVATTSSRAECPPYPVQERTVLSNVPATPFALHEWGVWRLGPNGRVASLEELARESPSFVHRAPAARLPELPDDVGYVPPVACEKPVIFFHSAHTLAVNVTVRFRGGAPWLHYPSATAGRTQGMNALRFGGVILPEGVVPTSVGSPLAPVDQGHWWTRLRAVDASPFVAEGSNETEKLLFYDGEVSLAPAFRVLRGRLVPIAGRARPVAFTYDGHNAAKLTITGRNVTFEGLAGVDALRTELAGVLVSEGLSAAEASSLLGTWHGNLFTGDTPRVIWLVPRAAYDAMLPIDVFPIPTEMTRVGVVIQTY